MGWMVVDRGLIEDRDRDLVLIHSLLPTVIIQQRRGNFKPEWDQRTDGTRGLRSSLRNYRLGLSPVD